ncbi:MAG: nucleoside phosphorylase [Candidatus Paceibacterota bacterium]
MKSSSEYFTGKQYHLGISPGDLAPYILLCGDPDRAVETTRHFDEIAFRGGHREFLTITGRYRGMPVSVMATGIGPDNMEIAVIEASRCIKAPTFIRIGSCGAIAEGVGLGDLVISARAIPRENTSSFYLPEGQTVSGSPDVIEALVVAARKLEYIAHVGITCSTSSFYAGQGREVPGFPIREEAKAKNLFPILVSQGVLNFEMETSALYTLAAISTLNLRVGTVCAVYAERYDKKEVAWELLGQAEQRCIKTGLEAALLIHNKDNQI